jgi:predicted PurR-regulated permease PerM
MAEERTVPVRQPLPRQQITESGKAKPSVPTIVVVGAVIVCALYFGSEVLIPITLAVVLSFVLSPLMELLRRLWLPRAVGALLAVLIAIGVIISLSGIIGTQIARLIEQVPQYQTTIEAKVGALRKLVESDISDRVNNLMHKLGSAGLPQKQASTQEAQQAGSRNPEQPEELKPALGVVTQAPTSSVLELSRRILEPALSPIATLGIVLVVAIFTLLQKEDLRDRVIRLFGSGDLHRTTTAMDDAGRRLTKYFLTQLGLNSSFGLLVGVGLYLIGVPSPVLWGILGALLRFVPYIGSYIAAVLPMLLAAAVGHGWSLALWTVVLYVGTELIMGNAVEPMVYGHSTGLSPIAVIIAAIFWAWLWGPIGLILSTPVTLCLAVLGRHIEQLEFLDVLLGDRPALTPSENFYQRVLAGDPDEAEEQAERFLTEHSLSAYYDEVALEGLKLAATDVDRGVLTPQQVERINLAVKELVQDLAYHDDVEPLPTIIADVTPGESIIAAGSVSHGDDVAAEGRLSSDRQAKTSVLCVAGRGPLDQAASIMLAQLLERAGLGVSTVPHETVSRNQIAALDVREVAVVCISYLDIRGRSAHLRFLVRRIRQHLPKSSVLIGFWAADDPFLRDQAMRQAVGAEHYVSSLREALNACLTTAHTIAGIALPCRPRLKLIRHRGWED